MYFTSNCGESTGYFPENTKWGGTSTLSGLMPGGGLRGIGLGAYRPNQAMERGFYPGLQGMGDLAVDPTMLIVGIGALALGVFLFGAKHGPRLRKRKAARLRRKLAALEA